jgi:hypothetical protein
MTHEKMARLVPEFSLEYIFEAECRELQHE